MKAVREILTTQEYDVWFENQTEKNKMQIRKRLRNIELLGHFGVCKVIDHEFNLWELKWENGRRIYYSYINEAMILLLIGGNKNGQSKDISNAKKIYNKFR